MSIKRIEETTRFASAAQSTEIIEKWRAVLNATRTGKIKSHKLGRYAHKKGQNFGPEFSVVPQMTTVSVGNNPNE
jgi:hypothetical protein